MGIKYTLKRKVIAGAEVEVVMINTLEVAEIKT
jgi:hypothetical protein